jgi:hypothetical protein
MEISSMEVFLQKLIFDNLMKEFPNHPFMESEGSLACSREPTPASVV